MKVIAILGTYRKGKFTDKIVDEVLFPIKEAGHNIEKIYLTDQHIEFCNNCRKCMNDDPQMEIGNCDIKDDMNSILDKIMQSQLLILAAPTNLGTVTALMKRFIERFAVFAYWPRKGQLAPKPRITSTNKKALVITSSAMPGIALRLLAPNVLNIMKEAAKYIGYGNVQKYAFGLVGRDGNFTPSKRQVQKARKLGKKLMKCVGTC